MFQFETKIVAQWNRNLEEVQGARFRVEGIRCKLTLRSAILLIDLKYDGIFISSLVLFSILLKFNNLYLVPCTMYLFEYIFASLET